jgi:carbonic anhydrase|tara:strand:- start:187 stop:723 length:537 start_codon:yes stop_codon:yes gene_type:complete
MFMQSNFASTLYKASPRFQPSHLVLKSPSEHTINGHHYDIEMQVFHDAEDVNEESNIKHSATVIFFSVEEYDEIDAVHNKTLQDWFRQFKFEDTGDKVAPFFDIGDVLNEVDYGERWTYKGAGSEPPCTQFIYWNIIPKVYPIEMDRFAVFKDFLYAKKGYLGSYKNNRKIQAVQKDT